MLSVLIVALALQAAFGCACLLSALVARASGMRVDRLSIGCGRPLLVLSRGGTHWQLGAIPLGGFVQIAGRDACDAPVDYAEPRAFHNRPLLLRILPSAAVPIGVTLFAALLNVFVFLAWGIPGTGDAIRIDAVVTGSPAEHAGLRESDLVVAADGQPLTQVQTLPQVVQAAGARPLALTIRRDDGPLQTIVVTPMIVEGTGRIGVQLSAVTAYEHPPVLATVARGLAFPFHYEAFVLRELVPRWTHYVRREYVGPPVVLRPMRRQPDAHGALQLAVAYACYLSLLLWLPFPPYPGGRIMLILCGWRGRRRKLPVAARDLGELAAPARRFPRWLLLTLVPLALVALSPLTRLSQLPVEVIVTPLLLFGLATALLALGSPRAWVVMVNLLLLALWSAPATLAGGPDLDVDLIASAFLVLCLVGLAVPSVRPWFGQTCPACTSHGARPVWSRPRTFGCLRCGSCWKTRRRS